MKFNQQKKNTILFYSIFSFLILLIFAYLLLVNFPVKLGRESIFVVTKGENLKAIASRLKKDGYIKSDFLFQLFIKINGKERVIKAGTYVFPPHLTIGEIAKIITGEEKAINNFVIQEGETLKEIESRLKAEKIISPEADIFSWRIKDFLNEENKKFFEGADVDNNLEGYFFPDSYNLPQGLKEEETIKIFLNNFFLKTGEIVDLAANQNENNFYEILTAASLIEKEVKIFEEKRMVADIFKRRLLTDMPLQADAAICYAQFKSFKDCNLSLESFKIDSPYNLYKNKGYPPTPINNPGLESIKAVLNPLSNNYWYYLTDRSTGKTIFSKTYEEHQSARQKYL